MTTQDLGCARIEGDDELSPRAFENILYSMERNLDALSAFSTILDVAVTHDGGALTSSDSGLSYLMDRHIHDLSEARRELWQYKPVFAEPPAALAAWAQAEAPSGMSPEERIVELIRSSSLAADSRPAWHDLDTIAAKSCVHKGDVARVLFVLTGEDHAGPAYEAYDGNPSDGLAAHLLSMLINRTLAHGDIWVQVSTATGIDLMDLQRILEAMLAYVPRKQAITLAERLDRQEPTAADLRERFIADRLREGVEPATIAQAMNLRKSAVEKVAAQLLADAPEAVEPAAKAV